MRKIAVVYSGNAPHKITFNTPKYKKYIEALIYLPDLAETDLSQFDVLYVPSQLNERMLLKNADKIRAFSEAGGIVCAFGPQPWNWLPNQKWEDRETNFWWWLEKGADSGIRLTNGEHDLFKNYLTLADATWHQHGVYWPPVGCDTLISTVDGGSVLYIDKVSTNGTWIITTLDPDYHFGSYFMPATERFLDGFFPWLAEGKI
jgi:hypothetical protein